MSDRASNAHHLRIHSTLTCLKILSVYRIRPETEEYGISSFVYRARRPFHPDRLMSFVEQYFSASDDNDGDGEEAEDLVEEELLETRGQEVEGGARETLLRSKGFFWLASRPTQTLIWSQAGGLFQITPGGRWLADIPRDLWAEYGVETEGAEPPEDWEEPYGDRRCFIL